MGGRPRPRLTELREEWEGWERRRWAMASHRPLTIDKVRQR